MELEKIINTNNICPITNQWCDDECCPIGAECNLSGTGKIFSGPISE